MQKMSEGLEGKYWFKRHRNPGGCTSPSVSDGPVQSELLSHARLSF